ncbi:MAG: type 1 glutamine amidotransferase [Oceanococcus sp.]
MLIQVLQHVAFEGPAQIGQFLTTMGHQIVVTHLYQGQSPGKVEHFDALVLMGGPMSANDEAEFPWLAVEKTYVRSAMEQGKPVLGICLGAQIIAAALGARVYPNVCTEIGWFPVAVTERGQQEWGFPAQLPVLHWHGETFDLPAQAALLASSAVCRNQAFSVGAKVLGLQFHLEMDSVAIALISEHCRDELQAETWVQSAEQLASIAPQELASAHQQLQRMLTRWLSSVN